MKYKNIRLALMALFALSLTSCACDANFRSYVAAHRLNYNLTRHHYVSLVNKDTSISEVDKGIHTRRIDAEEAMISDAEKLLGVKK